jgi:transcriptional regulator with GAF, ATPase, and Fis domain
VPDEHRGQVAVEHHVARIEVVLEHAATTVGRHDHPDRRQFLVAQTADLASGLGHNQNLTTRASFKFHDNPWLTLTTWGCHNEGMSKQVETAEHQEMVARLKEVRAAAIAAMRRTAELARERRRIMEVLLAEGFSQADLARELGVTRQAIQKMIAAGAERPGK